MAFWLERHTPDGMLLYGYGEYKKSIVDVVKTPAYKSLVPNITSLGPLSTPIRTMLKAIEDKLVAQGRLAVANAVKSVDQHTAIPTYYIWVKTGSRRLIGGEWNFLSGGKDALLSWFPTFEKCITGAGSSQHPDACVAQTYAWPTIKTAADIANRPDDEFPTSGMILPVAIIGAVVLYALLGR
jgi:hypothetical protein